MVAKKNARQPQRGVADLLIGLLVCWLSWPLPGVRAEEPAVTLPTESSVERVTPEKALARLQSADPLERQQGLLELGMLRTSQQLGPVTAALEDPHLDVRRAAIVALRLIQGSEAILQLEELATASRLPVVREQAIHELEALKSAQSLPLLVRALKDRHLEVRVAAIEALGAIADPTALPPLQRMLTHRNTRLRRAAAAALGHLGAAAAPAVPALIKRLRADRDENVRVEAAEALRRIGDARAVEPCLQALNDPADRVRLEAFTALEAWAQPGMEPLLANYLNRGRPHVRVYAARLLAKIRTPLALELLRVRLAREVHDDVAAALVEAIHVIEQRS